MDLKLKSSCQNCNQPYNLAAISPAITGRLPLNLKCGHNMCETCLKKVVKHKEPIECRFCSETNEIFEGDLKILQDVDNVQKVFPLNKHMLGELLIQFVQNGFNKELGNIRIENLSLYQSTKTSEDIDLYAIITQPFSSRKQCNECNSPTESACRQCGIPLCDVCFNRIHVFKSLASHTKESVDAAGIMCPMHSDKPLEFYCETCDKTLCSTCKHLLVDKCNTHITLKEKNSRSLEELKTLHDKVDEVFRRLTVSAVSLDSMLNGIGREFETDKTAAQIRAHYARIHAVAQAIENAFLKKVDEAKYRERISMEKCLRESVTSMMKIKQLLAKMKLAQDPANLSRVNVAALLSEGKALAETNWFLAKDEHDKLDFSAETAVLEELKTHANLKGTGNTVRLDKPGDETTVPPAPKRPALPQKLIRDVREAVNKTPKKKAAKPHDIDNLPSFRQHTNSVSSSGSSSMCSANTVITVSSNRSSNVQKVQPYNPLEEGSMEEVYVSHINSPGDFFVQRACFQSKLRDLMRDFNRGLRHVHPITHEIEENKAYLGYFKPDNLWHRCRVLSVQRDNVSQPIYHVFFYDYGSQDFLTIENLRVLPKDRVLWPTPIALHCQLYNVAPAKGKEWLPDDAIFMLRLLKNKKSTMLVRQTMGATTLGLSLQCELATGDDGVNVAKALVFHGRAKFKDVNKKLNLTGVVDPISITTGLRMRTGTSENVIITHVESPEQFFIRKTRLETSYEKLNTDLETLYGGPQGSDYQVFFPEPGMCVAIQVGDPLNISRWRRGKILPNPAPTPRDVHLFLPDTGHRIICPLTRIRTLPSNAVAPHAMADECYLANVTKANRQWSADAIEMLTSLLNEQVSITVVENGTRDRTGVCLYLMKNDEMVCINEEICRLGYALRIGVPLHRPIARPPSVRRGPVPILTPQPQRSQKQQVVNKSTEKSFTVLQHRPQTKEENPKCTTPEPVNRGPIKLEVTVVSCASPEQIYVMLVTQKERIENLSRKLQEVYGGRDQKKVTDCQVKTQVVTETKTINNQWGRAIVLEVKETKASVFFLDFGNTETVDLEDLYEIKEEFASEKNGVIKCHLAGIAPASADKWPNMTCEFLQDVIESAKLNQNRFFITKSGQIVDKELPVELWIFETIPGAALEPDRTQWSLVNKLIIEQGLAIPAKGNEPQPSTSNDDETLSIFNLHGTIDEWLQLEPVKKKPTGPSPQAYEEEMNEVTLLPDWPKAQRPQKDEFYGIPTFIDMDFVIYLHDVASEDTLDMIKCALETKYRNSEARPLDTFWSPGQPAVAQFELDSAFYRGRVIQQHENGMYQVIFVDYGNVELVKAQNMRKTLATTTTPIQAIKCQLHNIAPVNVNWQENELDFVHKAIVVKKCYIKIVGEKVDDIYPIEMKLGNTDISAMLVSLQYAVYKDDPTFVPFRQKPVPIGEPETDDNEEKYNLLAGPVDWNQMVEESKPAYKTPLLDDSFFCQVISVTTESNIEIVLDDDTPDFKDFPELMRSLEEEGDSRPVIDSATVQFGKPCIARFSDDMVWYRSVLIGENNGKYRVQYVDFGNDEELDISEIRTIKDEWMSMPAKSMSVKLHGLKRAPNVELSEIFGEYGKLFGEKTLLAKVVSREGGLTIDLYDEDNVNVVYQSLIDQGILVRED